VSQKTELKFEVEETFTVKQGGMVVTEFCPRCDKPTVMVSPEVLSLATGATEREIFRLVEGGHVHFIEEGRLCVCTGCFLGPPLEMAVAMAE
jgi:hypothetical protein